MANYTHIIWDEDSAYHKRECYIQRGPKVENDLIVVAVKDPKSFSNSTSVFVSFSEIKTLREVKLNEI